MHVCARALLKAAVLCFLTFKCLQIGIVLDILSAAACASFVLVIVLDILVICLVIFWTPGMPQPNLLVLCSTCIEVEQSNYLADD